MKSRSSNAALFGAIFLLASLAFVWWSNSKVETLRLSQNKITAQLTLDSYEDEILSGTIVFAGDGSSQEADLDPASFSATLILPGEDNTQELTYTDTQLYRKWGEQTLTCTFQLPVAATEERLSIQVEGFDAYFRFFLPTVEAEVSESAAA